MLLDNISGEDISKLVTVAKQAYAIYQKSEKKRRHPFASIAPQDLVDALHHAIRYLTSDRLTHGPGKGGWGQSDQVYMRDIYGPEQQGKIHDSVMTTAVVIRALNACAFLWRYAGIHEMMSVRTSASDLLDDALDDYLSKRWNENSGCGGTLAVGRENDLEIRQSYRHTAWLLQVWIRMAEYANRIDRTLRYLLNQFDAVDWKREKVATSVAVHSSFKLALETENCLNMKEAAILMNRLEAIIASKYEPNIQGWTSGPSQDGGRQSYTLFLLTELHYLFKNTASQVRLAMDKSLAETVSGCWGPLCGGGIPRLPKGSSDINMSCLFVSALARKPVLTHDQGAIGQQVARYVVSTINGSGMDAQNIYSWTISYFVEDLCMFLVNSEA